MRDLCEKRATLRARLLLHQRVVSSQELEERQLEEKETSDNASVIEEEEVEVEEAPTRQSLEPSKAMLLMEKKVGLLPCRKSQILASQLKSCHKPFAPPREIESDEIDYDKENMNGGNINHDGATEGRNISNTRSSRRLRLQGEGPAHAIKAVTGMR